MIYRKRAYTPPPLRRVEGAEYVIEVRLPDGGVLRSSYLLKDRERLQMREPRTIIAAELMRMRRTLRERAAAYMLGLRSV